MTNVLFYYDQPPESFFYQGLALIKLDQASKAKGIFNKLINHGEKHLFDEVAIDFFATSFPDVQAFEDDLQKLNVVNCHYLIGLGNLGLQRFEVAEEEFQKVLTMDVNHQGAQIHLGMIRQAHKL